MSENKNRLLKASTFLFFLNILASALNYLCQLLMARVLNVESYGTINTIFSFMMIVAVPGTTLTMIVARYYASNNEKSNRSGYLKKQLQIVCGLTIVVFAVLIVGISFFRNFLLIQDKFVLLFTFILAALGYFQPLYSGIFSGNKCFVLVGIYSLFIPIYKLLAVGGAFLYSKDDKLRLYMMLIIMLVGVLVTAFFGQIKAERIVGKICKSDTYNNRLYSSDDANTLILNMSLMLYMNIDLLAVRYYGNEMESGLYSAVLLFGRIIYYFATTLGTVLLPSVAEAHLSDKERRNTLNRTLILMILFAMGCMIPLNLGKDVFVQLLYGKQYLSASKYVIFVSIISFALSIYTIMVNYVVGVGKTKAATIIMCIVDIFLMLLLIFVKELSLILTSIGVIGIFGAMAVYCLAIKKNSYYIKG